MEEIREPMLEYKTEVQERKGKSIGIKKRSHLCSFICFQRLLWPASSRALAAAERQARRQRMKSGDWKERFEAASFSSGCDGVDQKKKKKAAQPWKLRRGFGRNDEKWQEF
jgi:hypothetical protein